MAVKKSVGQSVRAVQLLSEYDVGTTDSYSDDKHIVTGLHCRSDDGVRRADTYSVPASALEVAADSELIVAQTVSAEHCRSLVAVADAVSYSLLVLHVDTDAHTRSLVAVGSVDSNCVPSTAQIVNPAH